MVPSFGISGENPEWARSRPLADAEEIGRDFSRGLFGVDEVFAEEKTRECELRARTHPMVAVREVDIAIVWCAPPGDLPVYFELLAPIRMVHAVVASHEIP